MPIMENEGVKYFEFDILKDIKWLNHCFSTVHGGVSDGYYSTMNLDLNNGKGDDPMKVKANLEILKSAVGLKGNEIFSNQIHSTNVLLVDENTEKPKDVDGFVTKEKGHLLTTFYADCVPLYFVDTKNKIIALSHSGWKGTANNMVKSTIEAMIQNGAEVEYIKFAIGPSIHQDCFEVDYPVYKEFDYPWIDDYTKQKNDKYYMDLQGINKHYALELGILEDNIEIAPYCTKCSDDFYSHRRQGSQRGSLAGFMEIV